jgi:hypothetical protein
MNAKDTVLSLYKAYGSGDPAQITALLHEDVVWVAPAGNATQVALGLGKAGDAGAPRGDNNLPRGLIVSCQARADNPLHGPTFMGAMALAARDGATKDRASIPV